MRKPGTLAAVFLLAGLWANADSGAARSAAAATLVPAMPRSESLIVPARSLAVCISIECRTIYSNCVKRQSLQASPDYIQRVCGSQRHFCERQCLKEAHNGPPPGGPPLRPPPNLRAPPAAPTYGNCYWDGSRPLCAGSCRPGFVKLKSEGSGCISGSRAYCCEPMGFISQP
jgi:hypothetical protein